jgi:hypothetical protein
LIHPAIPAKDINWSTFRLYQLSVVQSNGKGFSGGVSWNPCFEMSNRLGIRGDIGGMLLKGVSEVFPGADIEALLTFSCSRALAIEAGGGIQAWFQESGGTAPVASLGLNWMFSQMPKGLRTGVSADYSVFLPTRNITHEIKLGLIISLSKQKGAL